MENLIKTNPTTSNDFTEREPTNEERWVNDVNEEFGEDEPLVNDDPDEKRIEDSETLGEPPFTDEELAGDTPVEGDSEFADDDLFDDNLEDESDDMNYK